METEWKLEIHKCNYRLFHRVFNYPFDPRSYLPLKYLSKLQVLPGVCETCPAAVGVGPEGGATDFEQSPAVKL